MLELLVIVVARSYGDFGYHSERTFCREEGGRGDIRSFPFVRRSTSHAKITPLGRKPYII